ncbi:MAG TPA: glycosyltransferase [Candidatus Kapabacteria bacterium]|nr:glycosyltransferase [Candidatus Kapabacteria bacterium]
MDLSIIIVSYNVKDFLRGAIASVRRSLAASALEGEIIVVDNDSTDGSAAMLLAEFPEVRLHALNENLGFGRANNLALRSANGEYLLLLNPDTIVGEETLRTMVDFMREHPEAGLAGCKLLNGDGTFQLSCRRGFPTPWASFTKLFGLAGLFPNSKLFARYNLTYLPVDATYEVDALGGAFMMLSRRAYEATNAFDESFFMYGEDLDLCYRAKQAGFKIFYVHSTATVHFKGESTRRSALNEVNVFYEAMHVFVKKHYRASFVFSLLLRFGIFIRTVIALVRKYRGSIALILLDYFVIGLSVLLSSRILFGVWLGLPHWDYPSALLAPPAIAVVLLAILKAYQPGSRSRIRPVVIAVPAILIGLSSLTYFFKEFPASRSFVVVVTMMTGLLLLLDRAALDVLQRLRAGLGTSANPQLRRTLIIGTGQEALRIARLLQRMEFLRRCEVVGLIDRSLERLNAEVGGGLRILGDTNMVAKVVRDYRIAEVIFTSDAVPYTEVLAIMQRTSEENPAMRVNFSMVPAASEVLLGKQNIEVLTGTSGESVPLLPIAYNLERLSHRLAKRLLDVAVSAVALPALACASFLNPTSARRARMFEWLEIFRGRRTLVGVEGHLEREAYYPKPGLTSLAAVATRNGPRSEDTQQFDQYYARNHTIGMDCEILLKAMFGRSAPHGETHR